MLYVLLTGEGGGGGRGGGKGVEVCVLCRVGLEVDKCKIFDSFKCNFN